MKELLQSALLLVHFDPAKELSVAADVSPFGIGAVLSHRMPDSTKQPIAYTYCSLLVAEQNYSQLEKEGLAIIFAIKNSTSSSTEDHLQYTPTTNLLKFLFDEN